ncbi:hypothetical protein Vretimale_16439 [Volvox reticuliferus]|uniref:Uncharacterized protein n=1 Tax=Volvox reticuliferus TaxID=1737510 RepID=A0A8J4GSY5_9CHLO|nr:hypothetical protein Vretifemale_8579 [Volvox reticuliferus]GIM13291.1 hypothetical protein Vretimale_16439 [Volvox reticuliferus]
MPPRRQRMSFAAYSVPFILFILGGWWGLAQLVDSKRQLQNATRGLDLVEELDPLERMRRRYGLQDGAGAAGSGMAPRRQPAREDFPSMEAELEDIKTKVDIYNFDYKPVPRPDEDQ